MTEAAALPELRFGFFGDSICVGQGVSAHKTWATRLAALIEAEVGKSGRRACVLNPSINGDTSRRALERIAFDIQAGGVDAILIQFGLNDANRWETDRGLPRVSEKAFAANLEEMVERARTFGAGPILLNTNHPTTRDRQPFPHHPATYEDGNRRYNEIIRDVAARDPGIVLVDVEAAFRQRISTTTPLDRFLLADGLHLSEAGHDIYLDVLTAPVLLASRRIAQRT
jgi:acyl-CoA thioesterase I